VAIVLSVGLDRDERATEARWGRLLRDAPARGLGRPDFGVDAGVL